MWIGWWMHSLYLLVSYVVCRVHDYVTSSMLHLLVCCWVAETRVQASSDCRTRLVWTVSTMLLLYYSHQCVGTVVSAVVIALWLYSLNFISSFAVGPVGSGPIDASMSIASAGLCARSSMTSSSSCVVARAAVVVDSWDELVFPVESGEVVTIADA